MSNEFIKFQQYLKKLRSIYLRASCAFHIFDTIERLRAPNIIGKKKASENVKAMKRFNNFFVVTHHALNFYFLMELSRILDDAKQSLHLEKIINFAKSNKKKLNVDKFKEYNLGRNFLQELESRYEGIKKEDFEKINKMLEETKVLRKKITDYRDQNLAHEDLNKKKISISYEEVPKIFDLIKTILNIFSNRTDFSTTNYKQAEDECEEDTKRLLEHLKNNHTKNDI